HDRQQEEMWRPLLEVVLEEVEAEQQAVAPVLTAADQHASRGALFLPDDDGKGGLLLLPRNDEFEMAVQSRNCRGNLPSSDNFENQAAAMVGESASFALRGAPSACEGTGIAFASAGEQDQQDVGLYLSPALAECADGACTLRGVKGEIRVGELQSAEDGKGGWYMYAAADGTRVVWEERPSGILDLQNSIDVSDSLTMGDIEAGIMLSRGTADLSLNYVHRRAKFSTWEEKVVDNEDYVGVKLTFD
ncbi:MAG: hypothetical protein AAGA69_07925, partial [Pseudomonadota bacterium]